MDLVHIVGPSNPMPHLQHTHTRTHTNTQRTHVCVWNTQKNWHSCFCFFLFLFWNFLMYFDIFGFVSAKKKKNMCHQLPNSCCYLLKNGQPGPFYTNQSATDRHLQFCVTTHQSLSRSPVLKTPQTGTIFPQVSVLSKYEEIFICSDNLKRKTFIRPAQMWYQLEQLFPSYFCWTPPLL